LPVSGFRQIGSEEVRQKQPGGTVFPTNVHKAHQPPDALFGHTMALVLQAPRHLPDTGKRGLRKLLVDQ